MFEIRCSTLARVMSCAGPLFFKDLPDEEGSEAAKEGTAAGEGLRHLIEKTPIPLQASNGVYFTNEMFFHLKPLAEEIMQRAATNVLCEQRIDWMTRSGIIIRGQYDASYVGHDGHLYVDDLKYGWGIVEVKPNWQLLGYAIGEVIRRQTAFEKIILRILQPRPHHEDGPIREWVLTYNELLEYKERIEKRMDLIASGDKTLVTGNHCKYCPGGAVCPSLNKAFSHAIEMSHAFLQDNIDEKTIAFQLDLAARIAEIIEIRRDSLEALAIDRIKKGKIIPNYLTEANYGHRKWKGYITPDIVKAMTGKDIIDKQLLSPSAAEKIGVPKVFIEQCVERPYLGQKLKRKDASKLGEKIFGKAK